MAEMVWLVKRIAVTVIEHPVNENWRWRIRESAEVNMESKVITAPFGSIQIKPLSSGTIFISDPAWMKESLKYVQFDLKTLAIHRDIPFLRVHETVKGFLKQTDVVFWAFQTVCLFQTNTG